MGRSGGRKTFARTCVIRAVARSARTHAGTYVCRHAHVCTYGCSLAQVEEQFPFPRAWHSAQCQRPPGASLQLSFSYLMNRAVRVRRIRILLRVISLWARSFPTICPHLGRHGRRLTRARWHGLRPRAPPRGIRFRSRAASTVRPRKEMQQFHEDPQFHEMQQFHQDPAAQRRATTVALQTQGNLCRERALRLPPGPRAAAKASSQVIAAPRGHPV